MDEPGVPHEPKECKVVSLKGQPTLQNITGSDRDNTTILSAVSGSGETLPPLIIFQGKQIQTTCTPQQNLIISFTHGYTQMRKGGWCQTFFINGFWNGKKDVPIHLIKCLKEG